MDGAWRANFTPTLGMHVRERKFLFWDRWGQLLLVYYSMSNCLQLSKTFRGRQVGKSISMFSLRGKHEATRNGDILATLAPIETASLTGSLSGHLESEAGEIMNGKPGLPVKDHVGRSCLLRC
ncbi:hypothetical protein M426DRAFT_22683 [Hypoxylon sp. CI-4A]|nr:hypothetical protein M426DRAFT_22683 [Hypoxylon sp. CI-4A]